MNSEFFFSYTGYVIKSVFLVTYNKKRRRRDGFLYFSRVLAPSDWFYKKNVLWFHFLWVFLTSACLRSFSGVWEQQISSDLQDSSQYSTRSWKCCSLDGLYSSSNFQLLVSIFQAVRILCTNYNWYHRHPHVPQIFFSSPAKFKYLFIFSFSFILTTLASGTAKSTIIIIIIIIIRMQQSTSQKSKHDWVGKRSTRNCARYKILIILTLMHTTDLWKKTRRLIQSRLENQTQLKQEEKNLSFSG